MIKIVLVLILLFNYINISESYVFHTPNFYKNKIDNGISNIQDFIIDMYHRINCNIWYDFEHIFTDDINRTNMYLVSSEQLIIIHIKASNLKEEDKVFNDKTLNSTYFDSIPNSYSFYQYYYFYTISEHLALYIEKYTREYPEYKLIFIGEKDGASVAQLLSIELFYNHRIKSHGVYTFDAYPLGNDITMYLMYHSAYDKINIVTNYSSFPKLNLTVNLDSTSYYLRKNVIGTYHGLENVNININKTLIKCEPYHFVCVDELYIFNTLC
jgi:hypothetical protein